jgi:hypothetical protein
MGFGQPHVTGLAETTAPDALRVRPFDPCPPDTLGFELGGLLPLLRGLDRLVLDLQPDRELAGASLAQVHAWRAGQARQVGRSKRI